MRKGGVRLQPHSDTLLGENSSHLAHIPMCQALCCVTSVTFTDSQGSNKDGETGIQTHVQLPLDLERFTTDTTFPEHRTRRQKKAKQRSLFSGEDRRKVPVPWPLVIFPFPSSVTHFSAGRLFWKTRLELGVAQQPLL